MAKLYWRVKKNGKWTWKAASVVDTGCCEYMTVIPIDWENDVWSEEE